jgi:hypothetical protein
VSAQRTNDVWAVEVDGGALGYRVGTLKISARTAAILEYRFPRGAQKGVATLVPEG